MKSIFQNTFWRLIFAANNFRKLAKLAKIMGRSILFRTHSPRPERVNSRKNFNRGRDFRIQISPGMGQCGDFRNLCPRGRAFRIEKFPGVGGRVLLLLVHSKLGTSGQKSPGWGGKFGNLYDTMHHVTIQSYNNVPISE